MQAPPAVLRPMDANIRSVHYSPLTNTRKGTPQADRTAQQQMAENWMLEDSLALLLTSSYPGQCSDLQTVSSSRLIHEMTSTAGLQSFIQLHAPETTLVTQRMTRRRTADGDWRRTRRPQWWLVVSSQTEWQLAPISGETSLIKGLEESIKENGGVSLP